MSDLSSDEAVPDESEQLDQIQSEDSLIDRGVDDVLDEGYAPPDHWSAAEGFGNTAAEQAEGETLDQRLAQEVPDIDADEAERLARAEDPDLPEDDFEGGEEVGSARAGRLVDVDTDDGEDVESELLGSDVGIDAAAAGAEEAAVHVVDDAERSEDDLTVGELAELLGEPDAENER